MFGSGLDGDLCDGVLGGEFLIAVSAQPAVLDRDMFRSYVSIIKTRKLTNLVKKKNLKKKTSGIKFNGKETER